MIYAYALSTSFVVMVLCVMPAVAQSTYPTRPLSWVVPYGPGNITDNNARIYAKALGEKLGQLVLVENKPGAGGMIGAQYVAQAKPDGYTMLYASSGLMTIFPSIYKSIPYDAQTSFEPVNALASSAFVLVVSPEKPYKTIDEFVEYLRKNPGKVNYGSAGVGTGSHLIGALLEAETGTKMVHVPYKDASSLHADLITGTIDCAFDFTPVMRPLIESGKVRPLAVSQEERMKRFPEVPTFKERGYNVVVTVWSSIAMPRGTPPEIVKKVSAAVQLAVKDPAVEAYVNDNDQTSLASMGPDKLKEFYKQQTEMFRSIAEKAGIKPE